MSLEIEKGKKKNTTAAVQHVLPLLGECLNKLQTQVVEPWQRL